MIDRDGMEKTTFGNSFRIGMESVRATFVPMLVLWTIAVGISVSYCCVPAFASALEPLRRWLCDLGWLGALLVAACFCGLLPGVFQFAQRTLRPRRPLLTILAQTILFGFEGVLCYEFYRIQAGWFGNGASFPTLVKKMLVDQFVWTPLVIVPVNATLFFWIARDFSLARVRSEWPKSWFRGIILPNLCSHWCVNVIPNLALYAFPPALQIQFVGLLCAFWTLMCFQVALRSGGSGRGS